MRNDKGNKQSVLSYAWLCQEWSTNAHGAPERADASDNARRRSPKTLQTGKAVLSLQYLSCQAQERYWAQRSARVPLGEKKSNVKDTVFLFPILSFSCKRKNGRRKKDAIQDRFALFHSTAFGGTYGGLLRNAACPAEVRRWAADRRPYEQDRTLDKECRGGACPSR